MGNGQSVSSDGDGSNIPTSVSFLSNKKSNAKTKGRVVVVRQGTSTGGPTSSKNDDLIKRFAVSTFIEFEEWYILAFVGSNITCALS